MGSIFKQIYSTGPPHFCPHVSFNRYIISELLSIGHGTDTVASLPENIEVLSQRISASTSQMVHQKTDHRKTDHQTTKLIGNIESRVLQSSDEEETDGSMLAHVLAKANTKPENEIELKSVEGIV